MMSDDEVEAVVRKKMAQLRVSDKSGMGKLIGAVMGECKGRADGAVVKSIVEKMFA
jgi:uncharacterized protein YqeY